ncbi:MAG: hypothetical protein ACLUNQ_06735 [Oscillospiraceae bacterium]
MATATPAVGGDQRPPAALVPEKSITLSHELPLDEKIFHPELAEEILENFKMLVPFYKYFAGLCASVTHGQQREEI